MRILLLSSFICMAFGFRDLFSSYQLVRDLSSRWKIDDSHNHQHAKEVLFWSNDILRHIPYSLTKRDRMMIGRCCLLHDLMDAKYFDLSDVVREHLSHRHEKSEVDIMMRIMQTMSYSKIVSSDSIHYPEWEDKTSEKMFHIVREADLLSSYNLARMVEYRHHRHPKMSNQEIREEMIQLYETRMGRLIDDGLFYHLSTADRARQLDEICRMRLSLLSSMNLCNKSQLDILRFVNHLSIHRLLEEYV